MGLTKPRWPRWWLTSRGFPNRRKEYIVPIFFQPTPEYDSRTVAHFLAALTDRVVVKDRCWVWIGARDKRYGRVWFRGKRWLVHRLVYTLCVESVYETDEVCHNCPTGDNGFCCNPRHLWRGSHTDNMRDSEEKDRNSHNAQKGEEKPQAKLSDEDVRDIRTRAAKGKWGIKKKLAIEKGVSQACISEVLSGRKWKHVV